MFTLYNIGTGGFEMDEMLICCDCGAEFHWLQDTCVNCWLNHLEEQVEAFWSELEHLYRDIGGEG